MSVFCVVTLADSILYQKPEAFSGMCLQARVATIVEEHIVVGCGRVSAMLIHLSSSLPMFTNDPLLEQVQYMSLARNLLDHNDSPVLPKGTILKEFPLNGGSLSLEATLNKAVCIHSAADVNTALAHLSIHLLANLLYKQSLSLYHVT